MPVEEGQNVATGELRCVLRDWAVREDLDWVTVSSGSAAIPTLHSTGSGCVGEPVDGATHDRAWVSAARRQEIERYEVSAERSLYFCEKCVIRPVDSKPKEHPTGGNPLCPKCSLHHAGECV